MKSVAELPIAKYIHDGNSGAGSGFTTRSGHCLVSRQVIGTDNKHAIRPPAMAYFHGNDGAGTSGIKIAGIRKGKTCIVMS